MKVKYITGLLFVVAFSFCASAAPKEESKWKNLEDKYCLNGEEYTIDDLTDMVVMVGVADGKEIAQFPFLQIEEAMRYNKDLRVKYIVSIREARYTKQKLADKAKKLKMSIPKHIHIYQDFALREAEPIPEDPLPFFYVLDLEGKTIYQGPNVTDAAAASKTAAEKLPKDHPIFGQVKPDKLAGSITNYFKEGTLARPGMVWLKKTSMGKDADAAKEAKRLMAAIEQKKMMNLKELEKDLDSAPGMTLYRLDNLLKMWPELKADEITIEMQKSFKEHPDWAKTYTIITRTEAYAQKPIKKASEAKAAVQFHKANAVKLERLKKHKDSVIANEATK